MGRESLTEQQANAGLDPALLAAGRTLLDAELSNWQNADAPTQFAFRNNPRLGGLGDRLAAVTRQGEAQLWVAQNDWSGFPDPAEFLLIAIGEADDIFALAYFDDWPGHWNKPAADGKPAPSDKRKTQ